MTCSRGSALWWPATPSLRPSSIVLPVPPHRRAGWRTPTDGRGCSTRAIDDSGQCCGTGLASSNLGWASGRGRASR